MYTCLISALDPPQKVISTFQNIIANFFGVKIKGVPNYHWCKCYLICNPIEEGGMGLRDIEVVIKAFSTKMWWNFRNSSSLWAKFFYVRYCRLHHLNQIQ